MTSKEFCAEVVGCFAPRFYPVRWGVAKSMLEAEADGAFRALWQAIRQKGA